MIISPSIASADLLHAAEEVRFICGHFPDLHVDIEDGVHLDNISFGFRLARMICEAATRPVSLHLMVNDPIHWIPDVQRCGAAVTFVHLDHLRDPAAALDAYRRAGIPVGLGLSSRDLHRGDWKALAAQTDAVLMLTCDIDDPAQRFVPSWQTSPANWPGIPASGSGWTARSISPCLPDWRTPAFMPP